MKIVEAVGKVQKGVFGRVEGKNDLIGCATINDLMVRRGQAIPENHPIRPLRGFFYRLVSFGRKKKSWEIERIIYVLSKEQASSVIEFEDGYKTPRKY